jgi:hypothetical protein
MFMRTTTLDFFILRLKDFWPAYGIVPDGGVGIGKI